MKRKGFDFSFDSSACATCKGHCCMGEPGYVFISPEQIPNIAAYLGMGISDFVTKHIRKVGDKFSLKEIEIEDGNFACEFFDVEKRRCSIYPVRPYHCRTYPFWDVFKKDEAKKYLNTCPGVKLNQ